MRLQKGDPLRAFAREAKALATLSGRDLPVPELVAADPDHIVTGDAGVALKPILADPALPRDIRCAACRAAGSVLGAFHGAGLANGRPMLKDMCWRDGQVTLIDFERFRPEACTPARMRMDAMVMVFSAITQLGQDADEAAALIAGYRSAAPSPVWEAARCGRHRVCWYWHRSCGWPRRPPRNRASGRRCCPRCAASHWRPP